MPRTIIRGDSYALRRPLYIYTLVDNNLNPLNLSGCTIRTTYRTSKATIQEDPDDGSAVWKGTLSIDETGFPFVSNGMGLRGPASDGVVEVHLSASASRALPLGVELISDLEVTDAMGEKFTFMFDETIIAVDGVTHREEG